MEEGEVEIRLAGSSLVVDRSLSPPYRLHFSPTVTMLATRTPAASILRSLARSASTSTASHSKFLIVGGGSAGVAVAAQLQRAFAAEKRPLAEGDVAIIEPAQEHHCELWRDFSAPAPTTLTGDLFDPQISPDGRLCTSLDFCPPFEAALASES